MSKKAIITILGMIKHTKWDIQTKKTLLKDESDKAIYLIDEKLQDRFKLSKDRYTNMLPIICEITNEYKIVPLYTDDAKDIQIEVLKYENIDYTFLENSKDGFIKDEEEFRDIFAKINNILGMYDNVIVDITHGFRHLPILMVINLIITNIQNIEKIEHLIFAKEIDKNSKYMIIDLKEYLDISNIALAIQSFISTLKVPKLDINIPIYHYLNDFSIHLTSNQFHKIFSKDIVSLKKEIEEQKDKDLFFVKDLLIKLETFLDDIKAIEEKTYHEKFLFFATLFMEKDYLLQSSTYLIEAITHYLTSQLQEQNLIKFDVLEYKEQQKLVSLLKLSHNYDDFNFPHRYFVDINIDIFDKLSKLRDDIADIRHNLAHINIKESDEDLKKNLREYIKIFAFYTSKNILADLEYSDSKKYQTISYILKQYEKHIKIFSISNAQPTKLTKIYKRYKDGSLDKLTNMDTIKTKKFCKKYEKQYDKLIKYKEDKILLLTKEEAKKLKIETT